MNRENYSAQTTASTTGGTFRTFLVRFKPTRATIFTVVFLTCSLPALGYIFLQPAIYQSYATLLTVAKTAIDQVSREADVQHVAIQKQILLGPELLAETASRLQTSSAIEPAASLNVPIIRSMLDVRLVMDTNLVEMIAEGDHPFLLQRLINTWIDVYLDARAEEIEASRGATLRTVQEELTSLSEKIELKRQELNAFRQHNDITTIEQQDNEALARLKGLNESLNKASEEEVKAKAKLDAIKKSIARGQAVVPTEDTRTLSVLEQRAQELREELEELDRQYTREYMALTPSLKVIPEKLAALEKEILQLRQRGQSIVLSDAEQEYAAARQTAYAIQEQMNQHRQKAMEFTARFTEHEALKSDLERMEELFRDTQERLVQIETQHTGKYPYVDVIERAFLPTSPIRPDYKQNAVIALFASLLFALIAVWLIEFLTRKEQEKLSINLSGIHLYNQENLPHNILDGLAASAPQNLPKKPLQIAAEHIEINALLPEQIIRLFQAADIQEKQLLMLLLSGLTLGEIATLQNSNFNTEQRTLSIPGNSPRVIPLHPALATLFIEHGYCLTDPAGLSLNETNLEALLACLQVDAGWALSDHIASETLRQTYILYLIKQGIRLSDLEQIVGYLAPTELSDYGASAPTGIKHPVGSINLFYPIE